jgi:hypothetical protein
MFSDSEKVVIRRHAGYQMFGGANYPNYGYRYFTHYGMLEFKLNNASLDEETVIRDYITKLNKLENEWLGAADNLDTDEAAVWKHNKSELKQRKALYIEWRIRLCNYMGIGPGPDVNGANTTRIIV